MKTATATTAFRPGSGTSDRVLVDSEWLQAHLSDSRVRVVEVDVSTAAYDDWHIDGAVLWNIYADLKDSDYRLAARLRELRIECSTGMRDWTVQPVDARGVTGETPVLGLPADIADVDLLDDDRELERGEDLVP